MPHLVYLTAGAAGMFCGSCMHDNALARAMNQTGPWQVTLVPTYTPIRTDEADVSVDQVFFGGINVYLQQKMPWLGVLPYFVDRWLDQPWLIRRLTAKASDTSPVLLGQLAVSMLRGRHGNQRKEVKRLIRWLKTEAKPDAIVLTNVLIGGCVRDLQQELGVPVVATLQGDDAFLDSLPEPYRSQATSLAGEVARRCDQLWVHSDCYARYMADYLSVPRERMRLMRLGIDTAAFGLAGDGGFFAESQATKTVGETPDISGSRSAATTLDGFDHAGAGQADQLPATDPSPSPWVIGYLARLAPEKGLHRLIDAFLHLKAQSRFAHVQLRVAGWLGDHRREWFETHWNRLLEAGLGSSVSYQVDLNHAEKMTFLKEIDLLCVPTQHFEPKGLFALEAMAAGVPVLVPARGVFAELVPATGGGRLARPDLDSLDPAEKARASQGSLDGPSSSDWPSLENVLEEMVSDPLGCQSLGLAGRTAVLAEYNAHYMACETMAALDELLQGTRLSS
jgi:glycosyltransferase involved in cell wall biosynthesis